MKKNIPSEQVTELPFHDAQLKGIHIVPDNAGCTNIEISCLIHEDEILDFFDEQIDIEKPIQITYENCWQISSNIVGSTSINESIDRIEVVEGSPLIKWINDNGVAVTRNLSHHKIFFNGGSILDVVFKDSGRLEINFVQR